MLGSKDNAVVGRPPCKKCLLGQADAGELEKSIDGLILLIADEDRADDEAYRSRLAKCDECAALNEGTCGECGCFVRLRAAKRAKGCPVGKWQPLTLRAIPQDAGR